jgi:hypothetical protein
MERSVPSALPGPLKFKGMAMTELARLFWEVSQRKAKAAGSRWNIVRNTRNASALWEAACAQDPIDERWSAALYERSFLGQRTEKLARGRIQGNCSVKPPVVCALGSPFLTIPSKSGICS